jgi:glutamine phosphoribosylpyrophosphate amidotransferase
MNHKCGIAGISFFETEEKDSLQNASFALYKMLLQLQHRGQLSAVLQFTKKMKLFSSKPTKD